MFKARAVVLGGVVVLPALAVAGLSRMGVSLPSVFSRHAIVSSEISITPPVAQQFGVQVARPASSNVEQVVDVVEAARMREAMARIVEGAGQTVVQDTQAAIVFSDEQEPQSIDHLREALGLFLQDDGELRLTQDVNVEAPEAELSEDSLLLDNSSVSAGAFGGGDSLADAMFPSIGVRNLTNNGRGVEQGGQAPIVQRLASNPGGFSGDAGAVGGRGSPSIVNVDPVLDPEEITSNGDTPTPGTIALGVIGLVVLRRRRA